MAQISILMPVYNVAEYLPTCLKSIQGQIFSDFELLMVDDGSTDESGEMCEKFAEEDARFHVRHQKNKGGGVTRNVLIDWCMTTDSRYIVWVDADDIIAPNYLQFLYETAEKNPKYNMVQCAFTSDEKAFSAKLKETEESKAPMQPHGGNESAFAKAQAEFSVDGAEELLLELANGKHGIAFTVLWNKIYRKEVYSNVAVQITSEISGKIHNDVNILWQVYLNAENCLVFNEPLYFYRFVSTSVQHKKLTNQKLEIFPLYCNVYNECRRLNYNRFADYLSEKLIFLLALNLGFRKERYENYAEFYKAAKHTFKELQKNMELKPNRIDIKVLYGVGKHFFWAFRMYGLLYRNLKR